MKRILMRALLLVASCALALAVLEVAVRLLFPAFDPSGHLRLRPAGAELPPLGLENETQRHVKNTGDFDVTVRFNRHGYRDARDMGSSRPEDIVVVGDSFSFGWGVEEDERYSDLLEDELDVKVFNVAMPTASLATYRTMIDHAARLGMQAGTMIAGVCMENDLALHGSAGSSRRVSADPRVAGLKERLKRKSAAYFMFLPATLRATRYSIGFLAVSGKLFA